MTYPQLNYREHVPCQSCSIDFTQDTLEYITYSLDRFDRLLDEYGPKAFYGGYEPTIVLAS